MTDSGMQSCQVEYLSKASKKEKLLSLKLKKAEKSMWIVIHIDFS